MSNSLQDQLTQIRRDHILDSATRIFAEKGFHRTTIKDIAKEASIADGTIYNYFANKNALLVGIFERMRQNVVQNPPILQAHTLDLPAFLRVFIAQPLISLKQDNFALFRVIVSEMLTNEELKLLYTEQVIAPTVSIAEQYLQEWANKGAIRAVNVPLMSQILFAFLLGLMVQAMAGNATLEQY